MLPRSWNYNISSHKPRTEARSFSDPNTSAEENQSQHLQAYLSTSIFKSACTICIQGLSVECHINHTLKIVGYSPRELQGLHSSAWSITITSNDCCIDLRNAKRRTLQKTTQYIIDLRPSPFLVLNIDINSMHFRIHAFRTTATLVLILSQFKH